MSNAIFQPGDPLAGFRTDQPIPVDPFFEKHMGITGVFLALLARMEEVEKSRSLLTAQKARANLIEAAQNELTWLYGPIGRSGHPEQVEKLLEATFNLLGFMGHGPKRDEFLYTNRANLGALCANAFESPSANRLFSMVLDVLQDEGERNGFRAIRNFRKAQKALSQGDTGLAIRQAAFALRKSSASHMTRAAAHGVRAAAFRASGKTDLESADLQAWSRELKGPGRPDGPVDLLAEILDSDGPVEPGPAARADSILHNLSRLAEIHENMRHFEEAVRIYDSLIDLGFGDWTDDTIDEHLDIWARRSCAIGTEGSRSALTAVGSSPVTEVIVPSANGFRIRENDAARSIEIFGKRPVNGGKRLLKIKEIPLNQCLFQFKRPADELPDRVEQLLGRAADSENGTALGVSVRRETIVSSSLGSTPVDAFLIKHSTGIPELSGIGFLLRPLIVGTQVETILQAVALPTAAETPEGRRRLISMLITGMDGIGGFKALESSICGLVIWVGELFNEDLVACAITRQGGQDRFFSLWSHS